MMLVATLVFTYTLDDQTCAGDAAALVVLNGPILGPVFVVDMVD
jgi:hypothetical protein